MTVAILVIAVVILLLQVRNTWVVHDTHWLLNALYEKTNGVDFDVRAIRSGTVGYPDPPHVDSTRRPS